MFYSHPSWDERGMGKGDFVSETFIPTVLNLNLWIVYKCRHRLIVYFTVQ